MRALIALQATLAILYFVTGSFQMNWSLWITLALNLSALVFLWKHHLAPYRFNTQKIRLARLLFTLTLILLELLIEFTTIQNNPTVLSELINDSETFVTGILIGLLWRKELLGLKRSIVRIRD